MRLLFASTFAHLPDARSGTSINTDALCRHLIKAGHQAAVLCRLPDDGPREPAYRFDEALGYPTFRSALPIAALAPAVDQFQPDIIIIQTGVELMPLVTAAFAFGVPVAVYLHDVETERFGGVLIDDPMLKYFANSPFTAERLRVQYGLNAHVVPPLIEPDRYLVPQAGDAALFVNPIVIKGVEMMFMLAEARPARRFLFAESWPLKAPWRKLCQARAARLSNIEWWPASDDMRPFYARGRVLVMPSVWEETWGRAVSEAQVSGIPALVSERGNLAGTVGAGGVAVSLHAPAADWLAAFDRFWDEAYYRHISDAARLHAQRDDADPTRLVAGFVAALDSHRHRCAQAA